LVILGSTQHGDTCMSANLIICQCPFPGLQWHIDMLSKRHTYSIFLSPINAPCCTNTNSAIPPIDVQQHTIIQMC
jgi:hypothetical protein